jgi:hypothetical protein
MMNGVPALQNAMLYTMSAERTPVLIWTTRIASTDDDATHRFGKHCVPGLGVIEHAYRNVESAVIAAPAVKLPRTRPSRIKRIHAFSVMDTGLCP